MLTYVRKIFIFVGDKFAVELRKWQEGLKPQRKFKKQMENKQTKSRRKQSCV